MSETPAPTPPGETPASTPIPLKPLGNTRQFRGRLARRILLSVWGLSLIPVLLLSALLLITYRNQTRSQVLSHLETLASNEVTQLEQDSKVRQKALEQIVLRGDFISDVQLALDNQDSLATFTLAQSRLLQTYGLLQTTDNASQFEQMLIVKPDGEVMIASMPNWRKIKLGENELFKDLISRSASIALDNPAPLYLNRWVIFTSQPIVDNDGKTLATLVGVTLPDLKQLVTTTRAFYPTAKVFYYTKDGTLAEVNSSGLPGAHLTAIGNQKSQLNLLLRSGQRRGSTSYVSASNVPIMAYGHWIPSLDTSLIMEIDTQTVYSSLTSVLPVIAVIFVFALLIISAVAYNSARKIVNPILALSKSSEAFAQGNWKARAILNRNDEIGLLAYSFNHMADQISTLYQSMETKVEQRTHQLRTATAVAQVATSTSDITELVNRATNLVVQRFNCYNASIYLVDDSNAYAILRQTAGIVGESLKRKGYRVATSEQSLVGWVAKNNQARVVPDVSDYPFSVRDNLLPQIQSEIAVPMSVGNQVFGVLHIQSTELDTYDTDQVSVMETLANQFAIAIQNIRLLSRTQDTLQGAGQLFQSSYHIVSAKTEQEILHAATSSLSHSGYVTELFLARDGAFESLFQHDPLERDIPERKRRVDASIDEITGQFKSANGPIIMPDLTKAPDTFAEILFAARSLGSVNCAMIPMFRSGKVSGVLVLAARERNVFNANTIQPYTNLMEIMGTTMEKNVTISEVSHEIAEIQTNREISLNIALETDINKIFQTVHNYVRRFVGDVDLTFTLYNSERSEIEVPYVYEGSTIASLPPFPLGEGLASAVIKNRKPLLLVKDTERQVQNLGVKLIGTPAKSWMGIPLIYKKDILGALILQDIEHEQRFADKDLKMLNDLAPQIAIGIHNALLYQDLQNTFKTLDDERHLLASILEAIPDKVYIKDRQSRFLRVNPAVAAQFNLSTAKLVTGKTDFDFFGTDYANQSYVDDQRLIETGEAIVQKIERETWPGKPDTWALTSKAPMRSANGEVTGLIGISRDITDLVTAQETARRQARQLQTASEIARDASGLIQLDSLLKRVVSLIKDRFDFYHASIFLVDENNDYAVLRESTGEAGQAMKDKGHRLAVGSRSIVGQVCSAGEPVVSNDVNTDTSFRPNPLLPDTRAELAVPLKVGSRILGAIDVQSVTKNAFTPEDIGILQILSDQLAIAVVNSELFAETQKNLIQHRLLHQITSAASASATVNDALYSVVQGLRVILENMRIAIMLTDETGDAMTVRAWSGYDANVNLSQVKVRFGEGISGTAAQSRHLQCVNDTREDARFTPSDESVRAELAIPLVYQDDVVGVLYVESPLAGVFGENDQEVLGTLGGSLAAIIANTRLVEQVRRQVERQRQLFDITSKIRRSTDINSILETSASEISRFLNARRAQIQVTIGQESAEVAPAPSNGNGHNVPSGHNGHHGSNGNNGNNGHPAGDGESAS